MNRAQNEKSKTTKNMIDIAPLDRKIDLKRIKTNQEANGQY